MTFFSEQNFHFHAHPKILMAFFSHRPGFSDFYSLFSDSPYLCCKMSYIHVYMTLSSQEKSTISEMNSLRTPFFTLFELSRPSHNTSSLNIGGTNAWAVPPPQIFWGTVPQPP